MTAAYVMPVRIVRKFLQSCSTVRPATTASTTSSIIIIATTISFIIIIIMIRTLATPTSPSELILL